MIKYFLYIIICLVILVSVGVGLTVGTTKSVEASNANFFIGLNNYRSSLGLQPIYENARLNAAARAKVNEMFATQIFEHTNPVNKYPDQQGYSFRFLGELLAYNFWNETSVLSGWKGSPSHNQLMVTGHFCEAGYFLETRLVGGVEMSYGALFLGTPSSGCVNVEPPAVTATPPPVVIPVVTTVATSVITATPTTTIISTISTAIPKVVSTTSTAVETSITSVSTAISTENTVTSTAIPTATAISKIKISSSKFVPSVTSNVAEVLTTIQTNTPTISLVTSSQKSLVSKATTGIENQMNEAVVNENNAISNKNSETLSVSSSSSTEVSDSEQVGSVSSKTESSTILTSIMSTVPDTLMNVTTEAVKTDVKEAEVKSYPITQAEKPIIEETLSSIKSNPIMVNNMVGYYFKDSIDRKDTFASGLFNSYLGEYEMVNIETSVVDNRDLYVIFVCFLTVFISFFALFQYWKKRIELI